MPPVPTRRAVLDRNPLDAEQRKVVVGLAAVALVALVLAFSVGMGPFGGDGGSTDFPTESSPATGGGGSSGDGSGGGGGSGGGESAQSTPEPPFDFDIGSVEECGQTCRDVTATLVNQQERRATGVSVYTRIHAGRDTDGDVVWEGTYDVGILGAGASETETQRVELGYFDALEVQRQDGWITIVLTIETDRQTFRFQERRDVA
jgi:hypothetical protein